jgi:hypothetical protein
MSRLILDRLFIRAALALWAGAGAFRAAAFSLDDIERWTGEGTNRSALVVDWHDGTRPHALAWGFRWNGAATALDLWRAVTAADPGLTGIAETAGGRTFLGGIEYRRPTRGGDLLPGTGAHAVRWTAYTWDHTGDVCRAGTWRHWRCDGPAVYAVSHFAPHADGLEARPLADGSWDAWSLDADGGARPPGRPAAALHYPFARSVVSYTAGSGTMYYDWLSGDLFTNPSTALGRPTVDTTGDDWYIPFDEPAPVVAVYPAFRAHELVVVGNGGSLTLAFDHPVVDHPDNPYGIDFIVFGNSFQVIGGGNGWANGDPDMTRNGGSAFVEKGRVSVSQDGATWLAYPSGADDPGADDFAPTLGRVYDTNRVERALGGWNAWWGGPTDPTVPVDPALVPADWLQMSVAAISERYRGSAGGTGFDLGGLALTPDPGTGRKWIRYVRVERSGAVNPEVDAVADVAPAAPYDLWRNAHFAWMGGPTNETDRADPDGDGIANLMEYGLGRDPTNAVAAVPFAVEIRPPDAPDVFRFRYTVGADTPDVSVEIVRSDDLPAPARQWRTDGVWRVSDEDVPGHGVRVIEAEAPIVGGRGFMRLRVRHEE